MTSDWRSGWRSSGGSRSASSWRNDWEEERQQRLLKRLRRLADSGLLEGTAPAPTVQPSSSPLIQLVTQPVAEAQPEERGGGLGGLLGKGFKLAGGAALNVAENIPVIGSEVKALEATHKVMGTVAEAERKHVLPKVLQPLAKGYEAYQSQGTEPLGWRVVQSLRAAGLKTAKEGSGFDFTEPALGVSRNMFQKPSLGKLKEAWTTPTEEAHTQFEEAPYMSGETRFLSSTLADPTMLLGSGYLERAGVKALGKAGITAAVARTLGKGEAGFNRVANYPFKVVGKAGAGLWRGMPKPTEYKVQQAADTAWDDVRVLADKIGASEGQTFVNGDKTLTRRILQEGRDQPEFASVQTILGDALDADPESTPWLITKLGNKSPQEFADWIGKQARTLTKKGIDAKVAERRLGYIRDYGVDLGRVAGEVIEEAERPSLLKTLRLGAKGVTKDPATVLLNTKAQKALRAYALDGLDQVYLKGYRAALEPYFVRPMTSMILSFAGFPVFNVTEGAYRQLAGEAGLGMAGPAEVARAFEGVSARELVGLMKAGGSVGGSAGFDAGGLRQGSKFVQNLNKFMGGYFLEQSRRFDTLQRGSYAIQRLRTRLAENLERSGIKDDPLMQEVIKFANEALPADLEPIRREVNLRVASNIARGPDAIRNLITDVNAQTVNRKAALGLLPKYSDLPPSVLKMYESALAGSTGEGAFAQTRFAKNLDQTFAEMEARTRAVDAATPEAIKLRVYDIIEHLPSKPLKTNADIMAAIDEAHALETSTAAYEQEMTERYFDDLDALPEGWKSKDAGKVTKDWRKSLDDARVAIEDGFEKIVRSIDKVSRQQGGEGLSAAALRQAKLLTELRLERHTALVSEANAFWEGQRRLMERVDPGEVYKMRLRQEAVAAKYNTQIDDATQKFTQAVMRARTREVPATVAAEQRFRREAMKVKPLLEPEQATSAAQPETVGRLRMTETGELVPEETFATEAELQGYREAQGELIPKGVSDQQLERIAGERERQAQTAAEKALAAKAPPTLEQLNRQVDAVRAETITLQRQEMELSRYLYTENPSWQFGEVRTVYRPRYSVQSRSLRMGKPTMQPVKEVRVSGDLAARLKSQGVAMEPVRRRPSLKGLKQVVRSEAEAKAAAITRKTIPVEGEWWAEYEDQLWGADQWMTEAFKDRFGMAGYTADDAERLLLEAKSAQKELIAVQREKKDAARRLKSIENVVVLGRDAERVAVSEPLMGAEAALQAKITEADDLMASLAADYEAGRVPLGWEEIEQRALRVQMEAEQALGHIQELRSMAGEKPLLEELGIDAAAQQSRDAAMELARTRTARFEQFKREASETLRKPPLDAEKEAKLREYLEGVAQRLEKLSPEQKMSYETAYKEAAEGAIADLKENFVNYDDRNVIDWTMQHIFPFWTYETRRWPYLARQVATKPFVAKQIVPMVGNPEAGQVPIPGTDMEFGIGRGMVFGGVRRLPVPGLRASDYLFFPAREEGTLGAIQKGEDALGSLGFYFGPQITMPIALMRGELGEAMPAPISTAVDLATAARVPGAASLQERYLDDPFLERDINQVLLSRGLIPSDVRTAAAQEDENAKGQLASARREASLRSAVSQQTSVLRYRPEQIEKMRDARYQAAVEAGVPEEQAKSVLGKRSNPITAMDEQGRYVLPNEKRVQAYERAAQIAGVDVEEIIGISELSEPLRNQREQEVTRQRHAYNQQDRALDESYQQQIEQAAAAFEPGVNGQTVRDFIAKQRDQRRGARQMLNDPKGAYSQYVAGFNDPERMDTEGRDGILFNYYMQAISDPSLTDELGNYDYATRDAIDAAFKQTHGEAAFQKIEARLQKNEAPIERELRLDQEAIRPYWDLEDQLWERFVGTTPSLRGVTFRQYKQQLADEARAEGMAPEDSRAWSLIDAFEQLDSEVKKEYRKRHPDTNALLIKWGYLSSAASKEAQTAFKQQYGYAPHLVKTTTR